MALAHFNRVKPIRGRTPELKPLGTNRGYTQCKITHDPLVDSVSAVLYETACVTIYPDNTIKLNRGGWLSPSTANFMEAVLPRKFGKVRLDRKRMIYTAPLTRQEFVIPDKGLMLKVSEDWQTAEPILEGAPTQYEYKADRKVMNAIRKNIKPFLDATFVMTTMSSTYTLPEIAYFYPHAIDDYVGQVNEHKAKLHAKEAGDPAHASYYGYFYGSYTLRNLIEKHVGAPQISNLSHLGENMKRTDDSSKLTNNAYGTAEYKDGYYVEDYLSIIKNLFSDNAETVRKTVLRVVTNGTSYAKEVRHNAEIAIDTMFGKVMLPELEWTMSANSVENYIIDVIKYVYADLIFKKVEVPQGVLPSTQNEKYVLCNKYLVEQEDIITRRYVVL
jgi:hypothetical protein